MAQRSEKVMASQMAILWEPELEQVKGQRMALLMDEMSEYRLALLTEIEMESSLEIE